MYSYSEAMTEQKRMISYREKKYGKKPQELPAEVKVETPEAITPTDEVPCNCRHTSYKFY